MAEAETKLTTSPQPQTSAQPTARKKRTFLKSIIWMLFFLAFFAVIAYAIYDYANREDIKNATTPLEKPVVQEEIIVKESPEFEAKEIEQGAAAEQPEAAVVPDEEKPNPLKDEVTALNHKIDEVSLQNRHIFLYFLARDLRDSISDKEDFGVELQRIRNVLGDNVELAGKLDILEQSLAGEFETRESLRKDLKILEKKVADANRKGFGETVSSAFGQLVKVTKVEGEVKLSDHESIIKRADIALSNEKLTAAELQKITSEVVLLGKPAEEWVRKANNLQRVIEITDYLVEYSKSKVTGI